MVPLKLIALCAVAAASLVAPAIVQTALAQKVVRVGLADTLTGDHLPEVIAFANAEKRGLKIELSALKSDDVTFQAVINGQVDIGIGDAYKGIDTLKAPVRHFVQLRRLAYFPVVNTEFYKTWKDLDGQEFAVQARGSGTEAVARLLEKLQGIKFSQMTYVPGSEVRIIAMKRGTMKATLLDLTNTRKLTSEDPKKFIALPTGEMAASDEAFFATTKFLDENADAARIIVEELLKAIRQINADPAWAAAERERLKLLPDLPKELVDSITPYFSQAVQAGLYPANGGGEAAAKIDLEFLALAGRFTGDPSSYKVEAFWDMRPLTKALETIGTAPTK